MTSFFIGPLQHIICPVVDARSVTSSAGDNCTKADVESFMEEVMRMKGFQHRNVMSTIGLVLRDNQPFAVLPYMKNGDLRAYISDQTKVRPL